MAEKDILMEGFDTESAYLEFKLYSSKSEDGQGMRP
jgi:hypothetical protein